MRRLLAIGVAPFCGDLAKPVDQALRTGRELLPAFVDRLDAVRDDRCRDRDPAGQGHGLGLLGSGRRRVGCANSIASSASTVSASPACVESRGSAASSQETALARLAALPRTAEAHRAGLAALSFRTVQGARDRGAAPRARDPAPPGRTSRPPPRRPSAPGRRQPAATAQALDRVLRHAGDARALAPPARGAPLDPPSRRPGRPRVAGEIRELVRRPARENPRWATSGSPASSPGSGSRYRRRPCASSCTRPGSARPDGEVDCPGASSSAVRRRPASPATSSPSKPSPCGESTRVGA
jgi:hypothetical protein